MFATEFPHDPDRFNLTLACLDMLDAAETDPYSAPVDAWIVESVDRAAALDLDPFTFACDPYRFADAT